MIKVLDQHTIDKIAAGEVIERPSSVVKELVENSIDSGATRITVEIKDGGISMIRVTDNGSGIDAEDVRKAYLSHATSKLDNIDDLLSISSLGFRGEALSTIAAVSKVEMVTKTHSALTGTRYEIQGGKEIELKEVGAPDGTTIITRDLFFNTPARLKFLKSNMTEGSYINDLMSHIALSNPEIKIKVISNGKTIIDTQGDGRLKETIYSLYGKEITKGLLEVDYSSDEEDIKVTGYIGKPYLSKGNRSFENYFVNKRYIKSAVVNRAIEEAYKTHIMQHKFPFTALFLQLPPYMVDVNVHPAKREFRFDNERALFSAVFHAVSEALKGKEMIPDAEADYQVKQKIFTPITEKTENSISNIPPSPLSNQELHNLFSLDSRTAINPVREIHPTTVKAETENASNHAVPASDIESQTEEAKAPASSTVIVKDSVSKDSYYRNKNTSAGFGILDSLLPEEYREKLSEITSPEKEEAPRTKETYTQLDMSETRFLSEEAKGHHKIIGQIFNTYWITEYDGSIYFMDQHAAHEKVNYERFKAEFENKSFHSQNIYPAIIINLSSIEKQAVMENIDYLERYGFIIEDFGGNEVKLSALPANLIGLDGREVFMELTAYLAEGIQNVTEDIFVRKLATMGCKAAIKGNQEISAYEAGMLIEQLMKLKDPYTCPHGRPTLIRMTKEEVDKKFKRIVE